MSRPEASALAEVLESALRELEVEYQRFDEHSFAVALPGQKRLKTACWLVLGRHSLEIQAFVMRRPDENAAAVHEFLLQRNTRMYAVAWSIDGTGDIYLTGRVPLEAVSAAEVDRILGSVLDNADGMFNHLLAMGFGSSIRREWEWRVKRGESLANLAAFTALAPPPQPGDGAAG